MGRRKWLGAALLVATAGCGSGGKQVAADAGATRYRTSGTVLEDASHPPVLCGAILESAPPQCGGVPIVGLDWGAAPDVERHQATTYANLALVFTFDGTTMTVVEPPTAPPPQPEEPRIEEQAPPCPPPPGGWPAPTTVTTAAGPRPADGTQPPSTDVVFQWFSQQPEAAGGAGVRQSVVTLRFDTDDAGLTRLRDEARARWGGPLCVVRGAVRASTLAAAASAIEDGAHPPGFGGTSVSDDGDHVEMTVPVADQDRQDDLDRRFGPGLVRQVPRFLPA